MNLGIEGKTALVIGASKDSGRAVAKALAEAGCRVLGVSRSLPQFSKEEWRGEKSIVLDMMNPESIPELFKLATFDDYPQIIVHVIGGSLGIKEWSASAEDYASVWRLNLGIALELNRLFLPSMIERGWGRIVHFSSNATTLHIGAPAYTSAKHAVEGYVRRVGRELARTGVVISGVRPGAIRTEGRFLYSQSEEWNAEFFRNYIPQGRFGAPEELAGVVAFLCSARASYMPGAILDVDGGMR